MVYTPVPLLPAGIPPLVCDSRRSVVSAVPGPLSVFCRLPLLRPPGSAPTPRVQCNHQRRSPPLLYPSVTALHAHISSKTGFFLSTPACWCCRQKLYTAGSRPSSCVWNSHTLTACLLMCGLAFQRDHWLVGGMVWSFCGRLPSNA